MQQFCYGCYRCMECTQLYLEFPLISFFSGHSPLPTTPTVMLSKARRFFTLPAIQSVLVSSHNTSLAFCRSTAIQLPFFRADLKEIHHHHHHCQYIFVKRPSHTAQGVYSIRGGEKRIPATYHTPQSTLFATNLWQKTSTTYLGFKKLAVKQAGEENITSISLQEKKKITKHL